MSDLPLTGFRIGVTAARKAEEQIALLERRGATVEWAPALSTDPNQVDADRLREATESIIGQRVDLFLATTGIGTRAWFDYAESWELLEPLLESLRPAEILARGPKSVGALRARGLRERWMPPSEELGDVLEHLRGRDLTGKRIVVQEHGQSLSNVADALRSQGADVVTVTVYRVHSADDPEALLRLAQLLAHGELDAVTFTSAPAVVAFMTAAGSVGLEDEVIAGFRSDAVAACVGPVTAAAFEGRGIPTVVPERSRTAAMVKRLEIELASRRAAEDR